MANAPRPGERLGRWTLGESLGHGAMATVFHATDDDGRPAAIKILHPDSLGHEDVRRFEREFETMEQLDHVNVVRVYEASLGSAYPWIALEYVDGADLSAQVDPWTEPPDAAKLVEVERWIRGICEGLAYIHARGFIHRDLKPQNVLLTKDGVAKISDFGVVKDPNAVGTALTRVGRLVGTVAFMAPEQITSEDVDARTDLYSLGAVMYLLLTGKRPIEASSVAGYLARHLTEVPPPPTTHNPLVPPRLSRVCLRLLAKDPVERYPSARAVLDAMDEPDEGVPLPLRGRDELLAVASRYARATLDGVSACIALVGPVGSGRTAALGAVVRASEHIGLPVRRIAGSPGPVDTEWDGEPLLIAIDDADRLDPQALAAIDDKLLRRASQEGLPLLVVLATSTLGGHLGALGARSGVEPEPHPLRPLDRTEVIGMLRDRGIAGAAAPVLGRRLHPIFGGLPGPIAMQIDALVQAGWLSGATRLKAVRPLDDLRQAELPVPDEVAASLRASLDALSPEVREAAEILAVVDKTTPRATLARMIPSDAESRIHRLERDGLIVVSEAEGVERVRFAHPSTGTVLRRTLTVEETRARAARAAEGLASRRRRADAHDLARLLDLADDAVAAYPAYVRAARRSARESRFAEVVQLCGRARELMPRAEAGLSHEDKIRGRRSLYLVEGEAQLARQRWHDAVGPLENAAAAARIEGNTEALARALSGLGRAHYRRGAFAVARPILEEALSTWSPGDPGRGSALRALADLRLRVGDFDGSVRLWTEARDVARMARSVDAETRAVRGLAHTRALQGRLDEAASLLETTLDQLDRTGDPAVRCGVLARALELDIAAGRLGTAVHRSERLLDQVAQHELSDRMPEAWALRAVVHSELGETEQAAAAARRALVYARTVEGTVVVRLRAARVLFACGFEDAASRDLPTPDELVDQPIEDPAAQLAALRARILATTDPEVAADLARWALSRPSPVLVLRGFRILVDCSRALSALGATEEARTAAKRALKLLDRPGTEGFRLDVLLALHDASPDLRVAVTVAKLAERVASRLPPSVREAFSSRKDLRALGAFPTD